MPAPRLETRFDSGHNAPHRGARGAGEPEGGHVKRSLWAVLAVAVGVGTGLLPASAGAAPQQGESPESDIGITSTTIRIAVNADVANAVRAGLAPGSLDATPAYQK